MREESKSKPQTDNAVMYVTCGANQDPAVQTAKAVLSPVLSSTIVATQYSRGYGGGQLSLMAVTKALQEAGSKVNVGDLTEIETRLLSQATALDAIFGDMARRAAANVAKYPEAFERYMKLALKAQNQSRMTLETLANVKNPPVVYAKQANINNGGQQQVNNGAKPTSHATETKNLQAKLEGGSIEAPVDTGATRHAGNADSSLEAVDTLNRAKVA